MNIATDAQKLEFARAILKITTTAKIPFYKKLVSLEDRRKMLKEAIDSLSDDTLVVFHEEVVKLVDMSEKVCKEYDSVEEQYNAIIEWLPRIDDIKTEVIKRIEEERGKYGLEI